jgi:hypothetical protein
VVVTTSFSIREKNPDKNVPQRSLGVIEEPFEAPHDRGISLFKGKGGRYDKASAG